MYYLHQTGRAQVVFAISQTGDGQVQQLFPSTSGLKMLEDAAQHRLAVLGVALARRRISQRRRDQRASVQVVKLQDVVVVVEQVARLKIVGVGVNIAARKSAVELGFQPQAVWQQWVAEAVEQVPLKTYRTQVGKIASLAERLTTPIF